MGSAKCEVPVECEVLVEFEVPSVELGVWTEERKVRTKRCRVESVKCGVWSADCGVENKYVTCVAQNVVESVKREVPSLKFEVWRGMENRECIYAFKVATPRP